METKHIGIKPLMIDGELGYPITITQAVVDPRTGKTLDQLLKEGVLIIVDDYLDTESVNPVQNKVITTSLSEKASKALDVMPLQNEVSDIKDSIESLTDADISILCPI
jgi:hypothetical protein